MKIDHHLEQYLIEHILPQIAQPPFGALEVSRLSTKMPVLLITVKTGTTRLVSKSFQYGNISLETAWQRAEKEYANLDLVRSRYGMGEGDFRVVAPLGKEKTLSATLFIEFGKGNTLDHYIKKATHREENNKLFYKLRLLARFLVKLHKNSQSEGHPGPQMVQQYLGKVIKVIPPDILSHDEVNRVKKLAAEWYKNPEFYVDNLVLVHGDATPTNFIFRHDKVTGIDLEKMKWADRCWDMGFLAAELKHHFLLVSNSTSISEPYIRHLLLEYAAGFQDLDMFRKLTRRLPLFMALGLFRIARNEWLEKSHRRQLIHEAFMCLNYQG